MRPMDLLEAIGSIRDRHILDAHSEQSTPKKVLPFRKAILIAAVIAMLLLLVGCVAVILGLRDLSIGTFSYDAGFGQTKSGEMISMQGYTGSPEYLAAKEWMEFRNGYDTDRVILNEIGDSPTNLDSRYTLYSVYTQEMCDKLDEITKKYGLNLHSEMNIVDQEELDYRVGGKFMGESLSRGLAYIYDDGTFQFDGDAQYGNSQIFFQCRRAVKGTFDEVTLNVGNIELYQESQYQTKSGETVLLANKSSHGVIIGDFEECFITINVLGSYGFDLTEEHLQFIADSLNYLVLKNVNTPDMRGDWINSTDSTNTPTESANSDTQEAILWSNDPRIAAYQTVLYKAMQYHEFPNARDLDYDGSDMAQNKFAILDLDGDGNEELVFSYTTTYNAGMAVMVYDIDSSTGMVREQFCQYPSVTYYDNRIIIAKASHNHGMGGDFWPYTLYRYNPETDIYDQIVSVDAWDKTLTDKDTEGNPFPDSIDQNGDGIVYYIIPYSQDGYGQPVDNAEYEQWYQSYLGNTEKIQIPYQKLTEQNVSALQSVIAAPPYENTQHNENEWEQAKAKFEAILSGEDGFFNWEQAEVLTIQEFCRSSWDMVESDFRITQFALSDLDHDGTPELILWENINDVDDCGFLVIRYDGAGGAIGYEFSYRGLIDLKYDGTFGYSGGVANTGFATLAFSDKGWEYDIFGCVEENEAEVSFRWGDSLVSQDEYWKYAEMQTSKESVQWMPYPAEHYDLSYDDLD